MFRRSRRPAEEEEEERFHAFGTNHVEVDESPNGVLNQDDPLEDEDLPEASADLELPAGTPEPEPEAAPPPASTFMRPAARAQLPIDQEEDASTVVGPATAIEGVLRTSDDVKVEGSINGTVEVGGALIVERGGSVDAGVEAGSVRVRGRLHGEVKSSGRLAVLRGGHIDGSFKMATLVIEEGATVQGRFSMRSSEQIALEQGAEQQR